MKQSLIHSLKHLIDPTPAVLDSLVVLRKYSAGNVNAAAALLALRHLEHTYGCPLHAATSLFRRALCIKDKDTKNEILFESLSHILDWVFRHRMKAGLWKMFSYTLNHLADIKAAAFSAQEWKMEQSAI